MADGDGDGRALGGSVEVADRSMIPAAMIEGLAAYILWRY